MSTARLRLLLISGGVVLLAIALSLCLLKTEKEALFCGEKFHDFGMIPVKNGMSIATHVFNIENHTNEDIEIADVVPSCSCIETGSLKKIPAKGSGKLEVTFRKEGGDIRKFAFGVVIVPSRKEIPLLKLGIAGRAGFTARFTRKVLDFGDCAFGKEKKKSFEIHCTSPEPLKELLSGHMFDFPRVFRLEVVENEHEKRRLEDGFEYHYYRNKVEVTFIGKDATGVDERNTEGRMLIALGNGEHHEVTILWRINNNE
jgi:hypothetical protein